MTIESEKLSGQILKWLDTQGYLFEMHVATLLKRAGNDVGLANSYTDFETNKQREIDVTAIRWSNLKRTACLQICTQVECKSSRSKPWVVFVSDAQPEPILPFQLLCSSGARLFFAELLKQPEKIELLRTSPLLKPSHFGHGLTQALKEQQDVAHGAIFSSAKASVDRVIQFDSPEILRAATTTRIYSVIAFPAIAVDAPLFECYLTESGEPSLLEVDYSVLLWRGINPINGTALIPVITRAGLSTFVEHFTKTCDILIELVETDENLFEKSSHEAKESILRRSLTKLG